MPIEHLSCSVTLYVPQNMRIGYAFYKEVARDFAALAGGATVIRGEGWWLKDDGGPEAELVTMVKSFVELDKFYPLERLARKWADKLFDLGEWAVAIETEYRSRSDMQIITRDTGD